IFPYMLIVIIGALVVYILIILLIIKLVKRKQKKSIKNNNLYCDIESTFYFTIEDGYLIRENEFSNLKLPLNKVKDVKLLKHGLILSIESERSSIFIPKDRLPISLEEFISLIKNENNNLIVIEEFKRLKKLSKKIYMLLTITFISACIFSFFIAKYDYEYNFKKYDLVMGSNLIKQDNNTYLYENENLGISLAFPSKWEGKFGIEEMEDRINVYYLANGKQSNNTTLLFSIRGLSAFWKEIDLNIIRTEGLYLFTGPTKISLEKDSKEHLEYLELYKDIQNIKLRKNQY
ncbi:hypothetical protein, partial [Clostridium sp.]|uniref:hypothetical protein n=1 Tax=Clostridium sp. TaxID=1506 RepID=UPI002610F7AF